MSLLPDLQIYVERAFPQFESPAAVRFEPINRGWESEIYAFDLEHGAQNARRCEPLILRLYPGSSGAGKSRSEFDGLQVLRKAGYPVPQVYHLETDPSPLGKPFIVMQRFEGDLLMHVMFEPDGAIKPPHLDLFSSLFVRLHHLDWKPYVPNHQELDPGDPYFYFDRMLNVYRGHIARYREVQFEPVLLWLADNRDFVPCKRASVVHLDFHPENILVKSGADGQIEEACVIDWTNLDISDPRFDLAWTLVLSYSYVGEAARRAFLEGYERFSGEPVEHIEIFEVAACLRRLGGILVSIAEGAGTAGMRPGAEESMKAQVEPLNRVAQLLTARTGIPIKLPI